MNLIAYDKVPDYIDKHKTWTDISLRRIISCEIKYRKYYCIAKRYDSKQGYKYFLILLDDAPSDRKSYSTIVRNCKLHFKFKDIWNNTSLSNIKNNTNISITHIEEADDGDIYLLDI